MTDYAVIIVGSGLVGASLALALRNQGLEMNLLDVSDQYRNRQPQLR